MNVGDLQTATRITAKLGKVINTQQQTVADLLAILTEYQESLQEQIKELRNGEE